MSIGLRFSCWQFFSMFFIIIKKQFKKLSYSSIVFFFCCVLCQTDSDDMLIDCEPRIDLVINTKHMFKKNKLKTEPGCNFLEGDL